MKPLLIHLRIARVACSLALLLVLGACAAGKPAGERGTLDLGGGISMTADGEILGATPARPSSVADDTDYLPDNTPMRTALPGAEPSVQREALVR
jgi:hypothetical protein